MYDFTKISDGPTNRPVQCMRLQRASGMRAGAITSADAVGAQKDDAAYPPSKHARTSKEQTTPKGNKAGKGGQGAKGGAKGVGTRGKAKMLADESRFSRPHPLQVAIIALSCRHYCKSGAW